MSLETNKNRELFVANGVARDFTFTFKVWDTSQVKTYINVSGEQEDVTSEVSVALVDGGESGGTVTFVDPPLAGTVIAVARAMPFIQEDRYVTGTRIDPHELEDRFDQDCAERQELFDAIGRCIKVSETSSQSAAEIMQAVEENAAEVAQIKEECLAALEEIKEENYAPQTALDDLAETVSEVSATASDTASGLQDTNDALASLSDTVEDVSGVAAGAVELANQAISIASSAVEFKGSVETFSDLPENADAGDMYVVEDTQATYIYDGTDWIAFNVVQVDQTVINGSTSPVAGGAVYTALAAKANDSDVVKKSGTQEITGTKTFTGGIHGNNTEFKIQNDKAGNTGCSSLYGGTDGTTGANLVVYGKSNTTFPGAFRLYAVGSAAHALYGKGDGTLFWDGKGFVYNSGNQEIEGIKTFKETIITESTAGMRKQDTSQFLQFGFTTVLNGARLNLFGKDYALNNADGAFALMTGDGSNTHVLQGNKDGTLKWDGNDIVDAGKDQEVGGDKKFTNSPTVENASPSINFRCSTLTQGSDPDTNAYLYPVRYYDKNGNWLGYVEFLVAQDSQRRARLATYRKDGAVTFIQVGFNASGDAYAHAPNPVDPNSNSTDIATTRWVTTAPAVIHNTGNQTVGGVKTFTSNIGTTAYPAMYNPDEGDDNVMQFVAGHTTSGAAGAKLSLEGANVGGENAGGGFALQAGKSGAYCQLIGKPDGTLTWGGVDLTAAAKYDNVPVYDFPYKYNFMNNLAALGDQVKDIGGDANASGVTPHNYTRNIQGTFVDQYDKIMAVLSSSGGSGVTGIGFFVWDEKAQNRKLIKYFSGLRDFAAHQGIQLYRPKRSDPPIIVSQGNYYTGSNDTANPQNTLTAHVISITYPTSTTSSLSWSLSKVFKMFDTSAWYTSGDNTAYKCRFCLSVDGRYMIALAKKKSDDKWYYRIWDFPAIMGKYANTASSISSPTNIQGDVLYEFEQKRTPTVNYTQGIFSDGTWIFNLFGANSTTKAYKVMYEGILSNTTGNFEGTFSVPSEYSSLGVTIMEAESIFFAPYNNKMEMFLGVSCINDGDNKYNRYYLLPSNKVTW